ncbi:MAG TPA: phage tail protein [Candidatus Dormibacteraeota bacterium]|nr:phage tail protein [Candidatus Dormibacteraeota bacterium]
MATRFDPYKNFKFKVKWDGNYVLGVSKVSALKRTTEVIEYNDGGNQGTVHRTPGRTKYDAITMERGVTHDKAFEQWANKVWLVQDGRTSLADYRKDLILEVFDEAGQLVQRYNIHDCWVSEFQALPDLDANANAIAIQHIKIENEGWIRDDTVPPEDAPSFTVPS